MVEMSTLQCLQCDIQEYNNICNFDIIIIIGVVVVVIFTYEWVWMKHRWCTKIGGEGKGVTNNVSGSVSDSFDASSPLPSSSEGSSSPTSSIVLEPPSSQSPSVAGFERENKNFGSTNEFSVILKFKTAQYKKSGRRKNRHIDQSTREKATSFSAQCLKGESALTNPFCPGFHCLLHLTPSPFPVQ
jgi:hypothetical protein